MLFQQSLAFPGYEIGSPDWRMIVFYRANKLARFSSQKVAEATREYVLGKG